MDPTNPALAFSQVIHAAYGMEILSSNSESLDGVTIHTVELVLESCWLLVHHSDKSGYQLKLSLDAGENWSPIRNLEDLERLANLKGDYSFLRPSESSDQHIQTEPPKAMPSLVLIEGILLFPRLQDV